jgi:hypothetical protein
MNLGLFYLTPFCVHRHPVCVLRAEWRVWVPDPVRRLTARRHDFDADTSVEHEAVDERVVVVCVPRMVDVSLSDTILRTQTSSLRTTRRMASMGTRSSELLTLS